MGNGNGGLNTLEYVQKLEQAGMPREQAEAQALTLYEMISSSLATKRGMKELETNLKRDMKESETNLKRDMKELEAKLKRDIKELETNLKRDMKESETNLKRDMKESESNLKRDMKESESNLKRDIEVMGYKLTIKMGVMYGGTLAAIFVMAKLGILSIK